MAENITQTIALDNGLTLEIVDRSCPVAGDCWQVSFLARISIDVNPRTLPDDVDPEDACRLLGKSVVYEYRRDRNFIDRKNAEPAFEQAKASFLESTLSYLATPEFPRRFVFGKLRAAREKARWYGGDTA